MYTINFATLSLYHVIPLFSTSFFSLFKLFFSLFFNYKKKKKNLFFPLLVHIYCYTFSNFSFPLCLFTTLYLTIKIPLSFSLSYILTLLLYILFCINLISFFSYKNCEYSLSLSLDFCSKLVRWFFFF